MVRQTSTVESVCKEIEQLSDNILKPLNGTPVTLILASLLAASSCIIDDLIEDAIKENEDEDTIIGVSIIEKRNMVIKTMVGEIIESRVGK